MRCYLKANGSWKHATMAVDWSKMFKLVRAVPSERTSLPIPAKHQVDHRVTACHRTQGVGDTAVANRKLTP